MKRCLKERNTPACHLNIVKKKNKVLKTTKSFIYLCLLTVENRIDLLRIVLQFELLLKVVPVSTDLRFSEAFFQSTTFSFTFTYTGAKTLRLLGWEELLFPQR